MKPDWCPQDVWAITGMEFDELYEQDDALEGGCEHGIRVSMAKLIMEARSQAFEEVLERLAKESKRYDRHDPHDTAYAVSQAIRQHSQKGETSDRG